MINYAIPGVYFHYKLNMKLIEMMKSHPEFFYEGINIEAVYGVFPPCIFDGGRIFNSNAHASIEEVTEMIQNYNYNNIAVRLVYTNSQLTPINYNNHFGNMCLELCNENNINQVVVADNNFMDYISQKYPKLNFISSTTKCLNKEQFLQELTNPKFIEVCLDYNLNGNLKMLESLSPDAKEKSEFLCNAICPPGCKTRKKHYELNSLYNLQFGRNFDVPYCEIQYSPVSPQNKNYCNHISYEDIKNIYEPMGFKHFKLEGRTFQDNLQAIIYSEYMIKPEYKNVFLDYILNY